MIGGAMMEPIQRRVREITYQVGWKRGKMINPADNSAPKLLSWIHRFNIASMWRHAGTAPIGVMLILLWMFPVLAFICSLWLVHVLMVQSE
jgi:hypothetical protein